MRTLLFLSLCCLGTSISARAQWQPVTDPVAVRNYSFAKVEPVDAQTAWFAYAPRPAAPSAPGVPEVYRTSDAGRTWQNVSPALAGSHYHYFQDLQAVDNQQAWAVVASSATSGGPYTNQMLGTTDGGATWALRSLPAPDFATGSLSLHWFSRSEGVLFSQHARALYRTTDGGLSWQPVPTLPALPASAANMQLYESGGVLTLYSQTTGSSTPLTHWVSTTRGLTWQLLQLNAAALTGLPVFRDAQHALTVQAGQLWSTADAGQSWTAVAAPPFQQYTAFSPVPGTAAYVAGAFSYQYLNNTGPKGSAITYDDGRTWTLLENRNSFATIRFVAPDAAWYLQADFDPLGSIATFGAIGRYTGAVLATRHASPAAAALQVYPNPSASGRFTLHVPATGPRIRSVRVLDALGREVYCAQPLAAGQELDLSGQAQGVYSLTVQTDAGPLQRTLLINR
ncbi:T9SS type A sorting domain-containing protein [Hymenobacter sp. 15J16-1T3B]|uniref:T9SS type A sorting domain-containing protein n=1 Tax=Hymenobacter sp. 15J16-1T3B TaxID=2886941 RepID=UPI001D10421E|nr:T9SS type A sorting domain-containing protein [Hymenobacter sp. 15J16-1T3B]MCC3158513.1 T9SS type A sorting domain-containing protein [Hymenobacter sp. 15J16-1T3B]